MKDKSKIGSMEIGEPKQAIDKGILTVLGYEIIDVEVESGKGSKLVVRGMLSDMKGEEIGEYNISSVKIVSPKTKQITQVGLWCNSDKEGKLPYNSAVAVMLRFYKLTSISQLEGKELEIGVDEKGFYCFKAY
jgi:hypothetical protein